MNKFKSLLLGGAAVAIAATGAQAADPGPLREPVYRCDITGFIELPGTDICFKVGGFARLTVWAANEDTPGSILEDNEGGDDVGMYAQGRLNFDARRSTDLGTVRAFIEIQATDGNGNSSGDMGLRHAFAQLGNWVFGKTWSTYLHGNSDPNGSDLSFLAHSIRINQIRYTTSVGNGLTLSIAVEDHAYEEGGDGARVASGPPPALDATEGSANGGSGENNVPSIVATINYANGGIDAQLSGLVKFNEYDNGTDDTGYGIMFGIGAELTDAINAFLKVNYTEGAPGYQFDWFRVSFPSGDNSNATGHDHEQIGVMGGLSAQLADNISGQIAGFWGESDNTGSFGGPQPAPAAVVNRDVYGAGVLVQWRPASGFDFLAEVFWRGTDYGVGDPGGPADTDEVIGVFHARTSF